MQEDSGKNWVVTAAIDRPPVGVIPARGELQRNKEAAMKLSTRYRLNGIFHQVKGTVRGFVGKISSNRTLNAKGRVERIVGKLQGRVGKVSGVIGL